jgi:hypothetical protein
VGAIAAPFMLMLGSQLRIGSPVFLPYLIFGAISCLAGLLVLLLPVSIYSHECLSSFLYLRHNQHDPLLAITRRTVQLLDVCWQTSSKAKQRKLRMSHLSESVFCVCL